MSLYLNEARSSVVSGNMLFLDGITGAITGYVFWILAARLLTSAQVGYAGTLLSLTTICGTLLGFGLDYTLLRDLRNDNSLIGKALVLETLASVAIIPILLGYNWLLGYAIPPELISMAIVYTFAQSIGFVVKNSLLGLLRFRAFVLIHAVGYLVRIPALLIFVYLSPNLAILSALVLMLVIPATIMFIKLLTGIGISIPIHGYWSLLKFSLPNVAAEVGSLLLSNFGVLLYVVLTHDIPGSGIFYIILIATSVLSNFGTSLATTSLAFGDDSDSKNVFGESARIGIAFTVPFIILLGISPSILLSLFAIHVDSTAFFLMLLAQVPTIVLSVEYSRLIRRIELKNLLIVSGIQMVTLCALFPLLADSLRLTGACLAVLISTVIGSVYAVGVSKSWNNYRFPQILSCLVIGFIPSVFLGDSIPVAIISALVSIIILLTFGVLKKSDLAILANTVSYLVSGKSAGR